MKFSATGFGQYLDGGGWAGLSRMIGAGVGEEEGSLRYSALEDS